MTFKLKILSFRWRNFNFAMALTRRRTCEHYSMSILTYIAAHILLTDDILQLTTDSTFFRGISQANKWQSTYLDNKFFNIRGTCRSWAAVMCCRSTGQVGCLEIHSWMQVLQKACSQTGTWDHMFDVGRDGSRNEPSFYLQRVLQHAGTDRADELFVHITLESVQFEAHSAPAFVKSALWLDQGKLFMEDESDKWHKMSDRIHTRIFVFYFRAKSPMIPCHCETVAKTAAAGYFSKAAHAETSINPNTFGVS